MWFFKKKRAEHALNELVEALSEALGSKLISIVLYGSRASGEYREGSSDVNVFLVLEDVSSDTLERMSAPVRAWLKLGHPAPVFVQKNELPIYANSLPIEFLDMQDHHKVIFGSDPFQGLKMDRANLRAQVAQELSVKQLKLRQAFLLAGTNAKKLREILLGSLPSILTLYRAVLRLEQDVPKGHKIMAAKELSMRVGLDGDCLERLWNNHMRRETDNVQDLARQYLDGVGQVLTYLSRK